MSASDKFIGSKAAKLIWKASVVGVLAFIVAGYFFRTIVGKEIFGILLFFYWFLSITRAYLHGEAMGMGTFDVEPHQKGQRLFFLLLSVFSLLVGVQMVFD